jgi:hypothetical protein
MRLKNMLIITPMSRKNGDSPISSPLPRRKRMEERRDFVVHPLPDPLPSKGEGKRTCLHSPREE